MRRESGRFGSQSGLVDRETRPPLKKSLFPGQRVAEIVTSRATAKSSFFLFCFIW